MSQTNLSKKRKEAEFGALELETSDPNSCIKIVPGDEKQFKVRGHNFYETVFVKRTFTEGCYIIGVDDLTKEHKKANPKACFRLGIICHTEEEEMSQKTGVYSLGSCKNSIALRSTDNAVISEGVRLLSQSSNCNVQATKEEASDSESVMSFQIKNELCHDYYIVLCLKNPKNPAMIKYFKDKLPLKDLTYSHDSYVAFFKGSQLLAKIANLREGAYSIGFSLYMEAAISINLAPNIPAFSQEVANNQIESIVVNEAPLDHLLVECSLKDAIEITQENFLPIVEAYQS